MEWRFEMIDRTPVHTLIIAIFSMSISVISFLILSLFFGVKDGFTGGLIVFISLFVLIHIIGIYVHRDKFRS